MKKIVFTLLAMGLSFSSMANPLDRLTPEQKAEFNEGVCLTIKKTSEQMQPQLPIDLDFATKMTGINAIYIGNTCKITYQVVIDEEVLISGLASTYGTKPEEVEYVLVNKEGRGYMEKHWEDETIKRMAGDFDRKMKASGSPITFNSLKDILNFEFNYVADMKYGKYENFNFYFTF